jgi:hypothetical protein
MVHGTAVHNIAVVYWVQGKYAETEPYFKRTLAIRKAKLGKDYPARQNSEMTNVTTRGWRDTCVGLRR